jgi:hypothetical protein
VAAPESAPVASRRWLLLVVSLGSLLILAYGGALISFSVPITQAMEAEGSLPGHEGPVAGRRALVLPARDPAAVPTFLQGGGDAAHLPGALLLVADDKPDFPAAADNATLVRALAFVTLDAEGRPAPATVDLVGLPRRDGENVTRYNLTVDLAAFSPGGPGWLVKPDATEELRFVPADRVVGTVERYESMGDLLTVLLMGGLGFVAPLVFLVMTHRPSGRPGVGEVLCAECRGPMAGGSDFCPRCGAWKKGRGS